MIIISIHWGMLLAILLVYICVMLLVYNSQTDYGNPLKDWRL